MIIISFIIGVIFGCWLSLSNLKDQYYADYFDMCKDKRKIIFIVFCMKSKTIIDKIVSFVMNDIRNVKDIWNKNKNNSKKEY